ncbi:hypothetical protein BKA57DRAFT_541069 [Linnemannia elongata]|nr:hypothetical protein BKA57DRAFT_541069 [Linnemannia elongata]
MLVEYRNDIWYPAVAAQLVEHFPLLEFIRITQKPNPNNKYSMCHLGAPVLYSVSLLLSSPSRLHVLETTLESIKAESIFGETLASLTKLEYLSFESMDHRMGTADIEWFASHLPRLKEMRGLVMENHVGMEPDPENDALVALIRRLRPDVAQRETFSGSFSNVPQTTAPRFSLKTRNAT